MNYNKFNQQERDKILKDSLNGDIVKLLDRYRLISTPDQRWISVKENSHEHTIFTQRFLLSTDTLGALFRINYLCFAKLKWFRKNINNFIPLRYDLKSGFVETELYNSDFLKHRRSGEIIDYRYLQRITDINEFIGLSELWTDSEK
ncbi:MAG: hypothetical protein N4A72_05545 [Bacteroidales bacterium]|jgi:hypothetical protein|nr:hypothetical protein [Bacteroidales bacterium]